MSVEVDVLKPIAEYAGRFGLKPELDSERRTLTIYNTDYPLSIIIKPALQGYVVELRVGDDIDEAIEELLGEDVDPRTELEDVLETMIQVVDYAVRKLREAGYTVDRRTREAILDVYDALESFLEEEE